MQPEQVPQNYGSFNRQPIGTTFEHGHQIDLHASDLELLEARADIAAATNPQPLEEVVQKRIEHTPLSPQEVVKMIGRKVVFDLRKGYNDTHIVLDEEPDLSKPYIYSPEVTEVRQPADAQVFQFPPRGEFGEHAESEASAAVRADAA